MPLRAKRKRAQVSYFEQDDELDELLGVEAKDAIAADDVEMVDEEGVYGSEKKPTKKLKSYAAKKAKTASDTKTKKKEAKPFPFLSLPAELRDQIYELALTDIDGLGLVCKTKRYRRTVARGPIQDESSGYRNGRYGRQWYARQSQGSQSSTHAPINDLTPALLAVSKQVHDEAVGYLYQQPIAVQDTFTLHSFLAAIGSNRSRVTDLTVCGWGTSRGTHRAMNFASLTLLAGCISLKKLDFDCGIRTWAGVKRQANHFYREAHYFLEAYGAANGAKDAAVDIIVISDKSCRSYMNPDNDKDEHRKEFAVELRELLTR